MNLGETIMPMGQHIGKPLEDIPRDYLEWLVSQPWVYYSFRIRLQDYLDQSRPTQVVARIRAQQEGT